MHGRALDVVMNEPKRIHWRSRLPPARRSFAGRHLPDSGPPLKLDDAFDLIQAAGSSISCCTWLSFVKGAAAVPQSFLRVPLFPQLSRGILRHCGLLPRPVQRCLYCLLEAERVS